ncbi:Apolipoprotein N-acyltransferase [Novipirellula galeiformis]|uniref:Apolipoprotein N-acyltransferase n=1 Tax=Novipirellula galeiformis TaxID=2528004 RepID=A0A5C6C9V8_9BACT|nr:apolipoprotein N-acyltransferase [Novipirellula galeiformis]TWU20271.1 Apolipoprotein N-acyltransferase [Novipirellula galeiformis]
MNENPPRQRDQTLRASTAPTRFCLAMASMVMLWLSQPPLGLWLVAWVALLPGLGLVWQTSPLKKRDFAAIWFASTLFWLISLQGIRHAHPAMYVCLLALAGYLGVYFPLFIVLCRRSARWNVPLCVSAPVAWVGLEWVRNYMLTGISAVMLGHTLAEVPTLIQIADLFGSYGVSFMIVTVNVAIYSVLARFVFRKPQRSKAHEERVAIEEREARWGPVSCVVAIACVGGGVLYGQWRLGEPLSDELATFALLQRDEQVEYQQDVERELRIFQNYASQAVQALQRSDQAIDAVVWPESMFTGGLPWMVVEPDAVVPEQYPGPPETFVAMVEQNQGYFLERANELLEHCKNVNPGQRKPHLVVGCGVARYGSTPHAYSGMVHISPAAKVPAWYGKNHLVMFGEYVPILPSLPGVRSLIPAGLGVTPGDGPSVFTVNDTNVVPLVCIETAVERVALNHIANLRDNAVRADVMVTVTNDGWFDDSSILDHHRRCAQLVAVGTRRSVLSSANNGPTAWIDSCGRLVDALPAGTNGAIIATPRRDPRTSLYVRMGDLPAKLLGLACLIVLGGMVWEAVARRLRHRRGRATAKPGADAAPTAAEAIPPLDA